MTAAVRQAAPNFLTAPCLSCEHKDGSSLLTEPLQVGQFAIVDHEPVDRGPNAGVFHGKGPADDRAELFIVAEGTTPAGEAFAGHVVSAVGHAWSLLDMSLTGSLRAIFREAERNLHDWNRKSIAQHRVSIGLTCFARRGNQAVLAHAGPSIVFHLSGDRLATYYTDEEHGRPIGTGGPIVPQLTGIVLAPGDRLLLISTNAVRELDDEVIGGILALPGPSVLQDLYRRLHDLRHVTAVLLSSQDEEQPPVEIDEAADDVIIDATTPPTPPNSLPVTPAEGEGFQPSLFIGDQAEDALFSARKQLMEVAPRKRVEAMVPSVMAEIPAPLRRASGESPLARLAAERQARATLARAAAAKSIAAAAGARPARRTSSAVTASADPAVPASARRRRGESFSRGLVREETPPRPVPSVEDVPLVNELADSYRARATAMSPVSETIAGDNTATINNGGSLVRMRDNMGGRWRGGGGSSRPRTANAQLPPTWLVIVIGLGILLALVGFVTVPRILEERSGQRYAQLVDGAQQRLATARVQQDPTERRKALTEAHSMLLEARSAPNAGPEVQQLIADVAGAIAAMDAIKSPASVDTIASLEQFGEKPVAVSRLVIGRDQAYILDSASGQVIAVPLVSGAPKVIYTEDKDARRARPMAAAYLESGDLGPALIVADAARNLWAYAPASGLRPLVFASPGNLAVTDIAVSGRDLYVLDAAQSTIFKFSQGDGGFAIAAVKALETPDLAAARRLLVDGEYITSDANGTVRRFSGQLSLELSQAGIDKRLIAPEPAQPLTPNGELAILDAPNDRIVVLRRDGAFDRQYRHKDFQAMSAFAVRGAAAYIFSGGKLRKVTW